MSASPSTTVVTLSTGDCPTIQVDITDQAFGSLVGTTDEYEVAGTTVASEETHLYPDNQSEVDNFAEYNMFQQDHEIALSLAEA